MILFESDWNRYPTAIADTKTTNESWVRMAALLKKMGIRNCYFPLALMQPELQGVDPHSEELTTDQKSAIVLECTYNPWYFFREVVRVPNGNNPLKFRINRGILAMMWSLLVGLDFSLIMPRQTGKSVGADALECWLLFVSLYKTDIFLFTKDVALRKKNVKRIKAMQALMPPYMNPISKEDADNTEVVTCHARGNRMITAVGQAQLDRAINVGRGETIPYTHTDECPYIPNVNISLPVMLAAATAARENAKEGGTFYGNLFTTTAGKKDSKEGKYMYDRIHAGMYWNEKLFDCANQQEAQDIVKKNCKGGIRLINGTFSHRQLGKTDEWVMEAIATAGQNKDEADRDYYNIWTSGTESSPLSAKLLQAIDLSVRSPMYTSVSTDKYMLRWYIPEDTISTRMLDGHYVIGLDSSNAVGRDANALVITDIRNMEVIATCSINEANLHKYAIWIADFLIRYDNTTLVIENKSSAQGIIDTVAARLMGVGLDPFKRMYSSIVDNHRVMESEYRRICEPMSKRSDDVFLLYKGKFGFMTTGNRRAFLYDTVFQDAVSSTGHLIKDETLSDEIKGLVVKNGRVDHIAGGHDDTVVAWLLCHWFVKYSKNLQHYGIDPNECLSLVSNDGAVLSEAEMQDRRKLAIINMEITELKDKLVAAPNIIESKRWEKTLAYKVQEAQKLGEVTLNIDSILADINKNKVSKKSLRKAIRKHNSRKEYKMAA